MIIKKIIGGICGLVLGISCLNLSNVEAEDKVLILEGEEKAFTQQIQPYYILPDGTKIESWNSYSDFQVHFDVDGLILIEAQWTYDSSQVYNILLSYPELTISDLKYSLGEIEYNENFYDYYNGAYYFSTIDKYYPDDFKTDFEKELLCNELLVDFRTAQSDSCYQTYFSLCVLEDISIKDPQRIKICGKEYYYNFSHSGADINLDYKIDAKDAALILQYSADKGAGNTTATIEDWYNEKNDENKEEINENCY